MFTPEREPHPAVSEIKYLMQPVMFTPDEAYTSADCVRVAIDEVCGFHMTVQNRYVFSTLDHLVWSWSLTSNRSSEPIRRSSFKVNGPNVYIDLESVISRVTTLEKSRPAKGNSYYLNLHGCLKEDATWAKAGHIVMTQQFQLKFVFPKTIPRKVPAALSLTKVSWRIEDAKILVESSGEEGTTKLLTLDPKTGGIESYYAQTGENMLQEGLMLNFVRAATDNDKGGFEQPIEFLFPGTNYEFLFGILHNVDEFSYWARWKHVGLDASAPPSLECADLRIRHNAEQNQIHARAFCHVLNPKHKTTLFDVEIDYNIWGDGRVRVEFRVDPTPAVKFVSSLPRVGVQMALVSDSAVECCCWSSFFADTKLAKYTVLAVQ